MSVKTYSERVWRKLPPSANVGCPLRLPVPEERVLSLDGEAPALEHRGLRAADRVLHAALAVGVTHPRRVGHDAVAGQLGGVDRIQFRFVQVVGAW
jgi:hypothetical protein